MENVKLNKIAERAESFGLEVINRPEVTTYGANIHMVEFRRPKVEAKNWLDIANNSDSVVIAGYFNEYTNRWSLKSTRYTAFDQNDIKQASIDFYIRLFADAI